MKTINTIRKISLATLLIFVLSFSSVIAQNDTMYIMKNGVIINKQSIKTTDVDSIIFYNPSLVNSTTVTDYDGNVYNTVTIGTQVWMKENLRTTKYANGTAIPLINTVSTWSTLTASSKAYCWYNDDISNKATYGALYTWAAAMNGAASVIVNPSGIQGVCPTGWHLPSDAEWNTLIGYIDSTFNPLIQGTQSYLAGGKMKSTGTQYWQSPNANATNESGFSGLPGGYRGSAGTFLNIGTGGYWWSSTEFTMGNSWNRILYYINGSVGRYGYDKRSGFSVRCIRD